MIADAEHLPSSVLSPFDLCVVGAGAAGIALTTALLGSGLRICVLESGGMRPDRWRQSLADAEAHGQPYFPIIETRARCFGGTTTWWNGECRPLDPAEDLEPRPWLDDPGWPIPAGELLRYYPAAQEFCGLGAEPFDPAPAWLAAAGHEALPLDPTRFVTRMFRYAPVLDFAELHGAGLRAADDVTVLLHAHAAGIDMSPDGRRAIGVRVRRRNAPELQVAASATVLATGGIENARLLLLSGLGNYHDLVGRHFMEHLFLDDAAPVVGLGPSALFRPYFRRMSAHGLQVKAALAP
ncbi:MAG: GMC family oxidoreductase N-terminal domain-containing protein, partial [Geminicoccaceae bacterium]